MFVIPVTQGNVALSIALGVLLLSIVVQPIVRACFYRMRSDRAWRSIEENNSVDVTKYSIFAEALGDRGKWDTARIVAIVLAAYHVCTWGLELSLDLAIYDKGPVDLLNRPPPVCHKIYDGVNTSTNSTDWVVNPGEAPVSSKGTLKNFKGSLEDGYATTVYRIGDDLIYGSTVFVTWSPDISEAPSDLFYNVTDGQATVASLDCTTFSRNATLHISSSKYESYPWGTVVECESGPSIVDDIRPDTTESPPTILLNRSDGDVHLIVEEVASYPSFFYSVWKLDASSSSHDVSASVNIRHAFFVSSTTRLVEAIITGIANGIESGGGCVDLLSQFSLSNETYELQEGERVSPFGEHPESSSVARLNDVESIVEGIKVDNVGAICGFLLAGVILVAMVGCLFSLKESPLDVYDRDALIKAVAAPNMEENDGRPTKMKVFVTRMEDDRFRMVVSDDGVYRGCAGLHQRLKNIVTKASSEDDDSDNDVNESAAAAAPPTRGISRTWSLPVASFNSGATNRSRQAQESKRHPAGAARTTVGAAAGPGSSSQARATTFVQLAPSPVPTLSRRASKLTGLVFEPPPLAAQSKLQGVSDSSTTGTAVSESHQHAKGTINVSEAGGSGGGGDGASPVKKKSDGPAKGDGVETPLECPPPRDEETHPVEDTTTTTSSRGVPDSTVAERASPKNSSNADTVK